MTNRSSPVIVLLEDRCREVDDGRRQSAVSAEPHGRPDDLTDFPASYKSKQNLLLIGLFVFLLFYFGLIALTILLGTYCAFTLSEWPLAKMIEITYVRPGDPSPLTTRG